MLPYKLPRRRAEHGGIVCNTGMLGGLYTVKAFDPIRFIPNGVYLTGFHSNWPTEHVMHALFAFISEHRLVPHVGKTFAFSDIRSALLALDEGRVNGKIVVQI